MRLVSRRGSCIQAATAPVQLRMHPQDESPKAMKPLAFLRLTVHASWVEEPRPRVPSRQALRVRVLPRTAARRGRNLGKSVSLGLGHSRNHTVDTVWYLPSPSLTFQEHCRAVKFVSLVERACKGAWTKSVLRRTTADGSDVILSVAQENDSKSVLSKRCSKVLA